MSAWGWPLGCTYLPFGRECALLPCFWALQQNLWVDAGALPQTPGFSEAWLRCSQG